MQCYVEGIGLWSPGLNGWTQGRAVLRGDMAFQPQATPLPMPAALHATERRRAPVTVRMAMQVAAEACDMARANAAEMSCVFASSHGDTEISDYLCAELAQPHPALSPTRFHNSVHNAASGYWTIATQCMQPSNAISAGQDSFAAGLLETALLLQDAPRALLVAYDMAAPISILPLCPIPAAFAVALVLSRQRTDNSMASLSLAHSITRDDESLPAFIPELMTANPAARSLPLLSSLANQTTSGIALAGQHWMLAPC